MNKEMKEKTLELIEQLSESINVGLNNVNKEINKYKLLIEAVEKFKNEDLNDVHEEFLKTNVNLEASLAKMNEHKEKIEKLIEKCKTDNKILEVVSDLLHVLMRK